MNLLTVTLALIRRLPLVTDPVRLGSFFRTVRIRLSLFLYQLFMVHYCPWLVGTMTNLTAEQNCCCNFQKRREISNGRYVKINGLLSMHRSVFVQIKTRGTSLSVYRRIFRGLRGSDTAGPFVNAGVSARKL